MPKAKAANKTAPKASPKKASSKAKPCAKTAPKSKAAPKQSKAAASKAAASKSAASKSAASKAAASKQNNGHLEDDLECHPSPTADKKLKDKEKRKERADKAFKTLEQEKKLQKNRLKLEDLTLPDCLGTRISFTVSDPGSKGSKIRVILASDSFYVTQTRVAESAWPASCSKLQAPHCVLHV